MKIINTNPPHIEKIKAVFNLDGLKVVFTYGDEIYNPTGENIPEHVICHEEIHSRQQKDIGRDVWWDRYLVDSKFRLDQELEAYRGQYQFVKKIAKNSKVLSNFLSAIAKDLSSKMYGNILTQAEVSIKRNA